MATRKAAAICYRIGPDAEPEFLLVRNRAGSQWVFPKGSVEAWEPYGYLAAAREAWEEAGVRGRTDPRKLGSFRHLAKLKRSQEKVVQQIDAYLLLVSDHAGTPEPGRNPTWFRATDAATALAENARNLELALEACTMLALARERMSMQFLP